MRELSDNAQGGREYDDYIVGREELARELWWEETLGEIPFDEWLDRDVNPDEY